jgi:hypothetical protein
VYGIVIWRAEMGKLNDVIRALECCLSPEDQTCEKVCPYYYECGPYDMSPCVQMKEDALELLKELGRLVSELSDYFPCCDDCGGKTTLGERTDECVYETGGLDGVVYCAKRGLKNVVRYREQYEKGWDDAVEHMGIVRCEDCKHYKPQKQSAHWRNSTLYCCRCAVVKVDPDDFCSYGERRTDENKL